MVSTWSEIKSPWVPGPGAHSRYGEYPPQETMAPDRSSNLGEIWNSEGRASKRPFLLTGIEDRRQNKERGRKGPCCRVPPSSMNFRTDLLLLFLFVPHGQHLLVEIYITLRLLRRMKISYEREARSFSAFSTQPSAPQSLKVSMALPRYSSAFNRSPFLIKRSA